MREPEFLPDWYRCRLRRSRRRRAIVRTAVALSLVTATGIVVSPEQAPAVVAGGFIQSSEPSPTPGAATEFTSRRRMPLGARRVLQALHNVMPGRVEVSELEFRTERGITTIDLNCTADDSLTADQFTDGLRGAGLFSQVELSTGPAASGDRATFRLRLTVAPTEAR